MFKTSWILRAALIAVAVGARPTPADMVFQTNVSFGSAHAVADIALAEIDNRIDVTLTLLTTPGDLRGFFFNVRDPLLLNELTIVGPDVTDVQLAANGVFDLGNGANIHPAGPFDAGVEIGTAGAGNDLIQQTTFSIFRNATNSISNLLTIDDIFAVEPNDPFGLAFGVRITSLVNGGSAKIGFGGTVPEPASVAIWASVAAAAGGLGALRRKRRPSC